jgi:protein-S-isoprenylcysteine O-methyltransferase Ste14
MLTPHSRTPVLVSALTLCLMGLVVFGLDHGAWRARHTMGFLVSFPASILWALARTQLGASFSRRAEARRLVTHGLYARIRNPMYLFSELATLGLIIFAGWWWLLLLFVVTIPMQVWRARNEARVLEATFGDEYRTYRKRTWF